MNWQNRDYREILKEQYALRLQRNPRYSLRAFARDLGLPPTRLSDILRGKHGLSGKLGREICARLGFSSSETEMFVLLVESRHARSKLDRETALRKLAERERAPDNLLADSQFKAVADWHHFAILELTRHSDFCSDNEWIGSRLDIPVAIAKAAVERLVSTGLLVWEEGRLKATGYFFSTQTEVPSEAIKSYHEQILMKAVQAIHLQGIDQREFSAINLLMEPERLAEAKDVIRQFRHSFIERFGSVTRVGNLYCLSIQLFKLEASDVRKAKVSGDK